MTRTTAQKSLRNKTLTPMVAQGEPRECELTAFAMRSERAMTYKRIGERFGVTESAARQWCDKVERWRLANGKIRIDGMRTRLETRYDYLYRLAHSAYGRSRQTSHSVTEIESPGKPDADGNSEPQTTRSTTETEHADGNPAWVRIMLECTNRVADLYGVQAAKQPEQPAGLAISAKVAVILANAPPSVLDGIAALAQAAELPTIDVESTAVDPDGQPEE